ncbi:MULTISPECIES: DUF3618 domain-containing protein [Actinomadura]|uniref:DUF3618 domain-containing protein n=1 Tax=Actinomadura litoris TaxID=2678616 RepID=A0A7K1KYJ6_9ACTN|nr:MULTISPECIES: DUF3618 domain-containing protein [Actinomadura]MBT2209165.1 DUF3618 domain-containing protein [Actinomadura sp. NEAU-AAG7]MUN37026.1 DUF3618 domain-containing protein [Actinomadura litoris]
MADRARDPEALERQIERTRLELARTIDELADRVNPKNVARRGADRLKEEAAHVAQAVGAIVRPDGEGDGEEPGGPDRRLLLAGAGVAVTVTVLVLWRRKRKRR